MGARGEGKTVDADPRSLADVEDPVQRVRQANALIDQHQVAISELSRLRREALDELLSRGMTQTQIAELAGMTRSRVGQLLSSGPRPERGFLGSGPLIMALGGKHEAGKDKPGPVVSAESLAAYERLAGLARTMGLQATYEVVPPPGFVTLNRTNLIVLCGPRLSPLVAQVLESDISLGFDHDADGWYLANHETGALHRSPLDSGDNGDIAYLGRLPRPDGRGTFLYMAGIHAVGTAGAAHYVENNLPELFRETRTRRFSTLIACRFDPDSHQIISSERIAPIYRHEGVS
ncbi:hypothetical protein FDG2_1877 [Candidatus Protofrankia californiensis]|uniref:Sigma-70 family RNA polymerase sigma factor n=1 Tax=Candidatus Protofrankia californiensis TaxID=1839754 RepID=A0A1C3NWI1_9ACTN|nr:hypothetical protein FDG2_1877 [Candidatus Protofrankia californiensis]